MKGIYPVKYFLNPNMDKVKSVEEIWDDIESYSGEYFEDEEYTTDHLDVFIPLPPLWDKGKFTKGILFTQGLEYLLKLYPNLKTLFFTGAYTMWSSYSWCDKADFYLACYENKPREEYHKKKYQNKKDIIFVPLQDADYLNEYRIAPIFPVEKNIDVLMVSTPAPVKNLHIFAQAVKIYNQKYNHKLNAKVIMGSNDIIKNTDGSLNYSNSPDYSKTALDEVFKFIKNDGKNIDFIPHVNYDEISKYYTNSKCLVLASLIEGKNRSINEAASCNTPVIVFRDHNKWARGGYPIFPEGSGEYVESFSPEALADTIYKVINNQEKYTPRMNYIKTNGRKKFIDKLTSYIPYYRENIPEFDKTNFHENPWIDYACQAGYQLSYIDFLYDKNPILSRTRGLSKIEKTLKFYHERYSVPMN